MPDQTARAPIAVGAAVLVVALAGAALASVGARQLSDRNHKDALRGAALAAAEKTAVDFSAYDYRHLQQDFGRVANDSTGKFKSAFQSESAGVQDIIIKVKAVSTAEVASGSVVSAGPTEATVIVALDRTIKNTSSPNGQNDSLRVSITVTLVHGQWLASDVKPL